MKYWGKMANDEKVVSYQSESVQRSWTEYIHRNKLAMLMEGNLEVLSKLQLKSVHVETFTLKPDAFGDTLYKKLYLVFYFEDGLVEVEMNESKPAAMKRATDKFNSLAGLNYCKEKNYPAVFTKYIKEINNQFYLGMDF